MTTPSMKAADLWGICVQLLWDDEYVKSLESLLRGRGVQTILDCGGGTGFPAIELRARGWDVAYVDNSTEMVESFCGNCASRNVQMPTYQLDWLELSEALGKQFDALLCRGNSLIYVGSWQSGVVAPDTRELIRKALRQFYLSLNEGGLLYLDLIGSHEYDRAAYPIRSEYAGTLPDGSEVSLIWEVSHDYTTRTRAWRTVVERDGVTFDQTYHSYLLRHSELRSDLQAAGFRQIESCAPEADHGYNVFLAHK